MRQRAAPLGCRARIDETQDERGMARMGQYPRPAKDADRAGGAVNA